MLYHPGDGASVVYTSVYMFFCVFVPEKGLRKSLYGAKEELGQKYGKGMQYRNI